MCLAAAQQFGGGWTFGLSGPFPSVAGSLAKPLWGFQAVQSPPQGSPTAGRSSGVSDLKAVVAEWEDTLFLQGRNVILH